MKGGLLRALARGAAAGLLWLGVLFAVDTTDSLGRINKAIHHLKDDRALEALLRAEVVDYVARAGVGYAVLGLFAGLLLSLSLRLLFPRPPRWWAWWGTALLGALLASGLGTARQIITFPPLHDWYRQRGWWADLADPWMVDAVGAGLALALLGLGLWRHRRAELSLAVFGRKVLALGAAVLGVALCLRNPTTPDAQGNRGPNVVLIGVDALRPDHLQSEGPLAALTPNIQSFLAESVVFDSAWTPFPRTGPSWMSILSGDWPTTHGVRHNLPQPDRLVPPVPLLPQVLRAQGYATLFTSDDSRFSYMVPEQGFDTIWQPPVSLQNFAVSANEPRFRALHAWLHNPLGFAILPSMAYNQAFGKSYRPLLYVERAAAALAEVSAADRFFYAVHDCALHPPADRIWPWHRMLGQRGYQGPNRFRYAQLGSEVLDDEDAVEQTAGVAEQDLRLYNSGLPMVDALVGRLVGELKQSGLWDNSVVVLLSDHGEAFWQPELPYKYSAPNHGFHPYDDGQTRVTLAIHFPDGLGAGRRVAAPVRLIDLAPTVAELLGLPWSSDGQSLLPLARGESEAEPRPVYIETGVSESRYQGSGHKGYPFKRVSERYQLDAATGRVYLRPEFEEAVIRAKDRVMQVGDWKLVWTPMKKGAKVALYDRGEDPINLRDVSAEHPEVVAELMEKLRVFLEQDGEVVGGRP